MNKKQKKSIIILAIIAVVFSIIVFLIPFPKNSIFWIAYVSELIALALQIPIFKLAYDNADDLKSKVLGFPIFRVGYIYLGVQTIVSLLLFALGFIKDFPVWTSIVLCLIVLAAAIVCSIAADMTRDTVMEIETAQTVDTKIIKELRMKSQQLVSRASDVVLKKELEKLAENFRYSDPVSSPATVEYETKLIDLFSELEAYVFTGDTIAATKICPIVNRVLEDRNFICKSCK